jgi:hypothetical protein
MDNETQDNGSESGSPSTERLGSANDRSHGTRRGGFLL